jgi:serralysin
VSGSSTALKALEPSFQQDLNGDGVIGTAATVIEAHGNTSLTVVGNNYALNPSGGGTGPLLKYGSVITVGQYGAWTFIGAEQISGGYEVALHLPGSDQYTVWNTDINGNVVSNGTGGIVSGASTALRSLETSFQQDLNGDGIIGISSTAVVIESYGNTSLTVIGNNYALNPSGGGTGPLLKYGSVVTVGQYGAWTFIGAEQISGGYEVALHLPGSDQYTVWNTDTDGNVVSNATGGIVSGSSNALKSLELSFQQDLNGDGAMAAASLPGYQATDQTRHDAFVFNQSIAPALSTDHYSPIEGGDKSILCRLDGVKALDSEMVRAISDQLHHAESDPVISHSINSSDSALVQVDWRLFDHFILH